MWQHNIVLIQLWWQRLTQYNWSSTEHLLYLENVMFSTARTPFLLRKLTNLVRVYLKFAGMFSWHDTQSYYYVTHSKEGGRVHDLLQDNFPGLNSNSKNALPGRAYSPLVAEMGYRIWSNGRTGCREHSLLLQLSRENLCQYARESTTT